MAKLTEEKVYSTIVDNNIKENLDNSPIWKKCYHSSELEEIAKQSNMNCYTIKFDGVVPIQVTKIEKLK